VICLGNHDIFEYKRGNFSSNQRAEEYLEQARFEGKLMKEIELSGLGRIAIMHAFYDCRGNMNFEEFSKTLMWPTLYMESKYPHAFKLLDQNNLDIVLRGHDHMPLKVSRNGDNITYTPLKARDEFVIEKDQKHIITVAAYEIYRLGLEIRKEGEDYIGKVKAFF